MDSGLQRVGMSEFDQKFEDSYDIAMHELALWGSDPNFPNRMEQASEVIRLVMETRRRWKLDRLPEGEYCQIGQIAIHDFERPDERKISQAMCVMDTLYNRRLKRQEMADRKEKLLA